MIRLRGAETVIVGIQPEVAFAMVQLGLTLEDVDTALDLEEGLAFLQRQPTRRPTSVADEIRVPIRTDADIVTARQEARALAAALGLHRQRPDGDRHRHLGAGPQHPEYAGGARSSAPVPDGGRHGIEVVARDEGPGIAELELAMQDGYSTGKASASACRACGAHGRVRATSPQPARARRSEVKWYPA